MKSKKFGKIKIVQLTFENGVVFNFDEAVLSEHFKKNIDFYIAKRS